MPIVAVSSVRCLPLVTQGERHRDGTPNLTLETQAGFRRGREESRQTIRSQPAPRCAPSASAWDPPGLNNSELHHCGVHVIRPSA